MLAGVKLIDRDTKIPWNEDLTFAVDDNCKYGNCKGVVHPRELDMCFPLHLCVDKDGGGF